MPSPALGLEDMGPGLWALTGVRAGSWNHLGGSGEDPKQRPGGQLRRGSSIGGARRQVLQGVDKEAPLLHPPQL